MFFKTLLKSGQKQLLFPLVDVFGMFRKRVLLGLAPCSSDKVMKQDREIREMKQKIAEVMAVSPGVSYMAPRHPVPQYLTKLLNSERYMLTPRALMYQCLKK